MSHNTKTCRDINDYEDEKAPKDTLEYLLVVERIELCWLNKSWLGRSHITKITTVMLKLNAHLEYQVYPAKAKADEGALLEGEGEGEKKFQGCYQIRWRQSKGLRA